MLSRESRSLDPPQVYLARTQTSKEELSPLQKATYEHATGQVISVHLPSRESCIKGMSEMYEGQGSTASTSFTR